MTVEEFISSLKTWHEELVNEVAGHFRLGRRERGQIALRRWKEEFTAFLEQHAVEEADRWKLDKRIRGMFGVARYGETPFEAFVRDDGEHCEAFIEDLIAAAAKGRVKLTENGETQSSTAISISPEVAQDEAKPANIFISYAHADHKWLEMLEKILKPLVRNRKIDLWADTKIKAGDQWRTEVETALDAAKIAVLLVSRDFLASDFIAENELPPLLDHAKERGVKIFWIPITKCLYEETDLVHFQAASDPSRPLDGLTKGDANNVLVEIAQTIREELG